MKCDVCGEKKVKIENRSSIQEIKDESIDVISKAHVCSACGNHYYDNEQMHALAMIASNEYRRRKGLLTSDKIAAYRQSLGMSQQEFAEFLAVGVASIKRWENIGIQDTAMDQLIRLKCDPNALEDAEIDLADHFKQDELSGNRKLSHERMKALISIFTPYAKSPLFINKAVWLADFNHYARYERGLTGSTYRHLEYGPVPYRADHFYSEMVNEGLLKKAKGYDYEVAKKITLSDIFGDEEIQTINDVIAYVKKVGHENLTNLSHKEAAWKETSDKEFISYEFAKKLKGMKLKK